MDTHYVCIPGAEPRGPYTLEQLAGMWHSGALTADTLIHVNGEWQPLEKHIPKIPAVSSPPPLSPTPKTRHAFGLPGGCLVAIVLAFTIGAIAVGIMNANLEKTTPAYLTAYYQGEEFIKQNLKSPSTAKFPNPYDKNAKWFAEQRQDGAWDVGGTVDAQNSFGAMLRQDWRVLIKDQRAIWWQLGGQKSGEYPKAQE